MASRNFTIGLLRRLCFNPLRICFDFSSFLAKRLIVEDTAKARSTVSFSGSNERAVSLDNYQVLGNILGSVLLPCFRRRKVRLH